MKCLMNYGQGGLTLNLPDHWDVRVFRKKPMPVLPDPEGALSAALRATSGSKPLVEQAKGCSRVGIVVCDITRPVPNGLILPAVIKEVVHAGLFRRRTKIDGC